MQNNPFWLKPATPQLVALLNALDANGVDVSYDCVRGTTLTNGTCGPKCASLATVRVHAGCCCFCRGPTAVVLFWLRSSACRSSKRQPIQQPRITCPHRGVVPR